MGEKSDKKQKKVDPKTESILSAILVVFGILLILFFGEKLGFWEVPQDLIMKIVAGILFISYVVFRIIFGKKYKKRDAE